MTLDQLNYVLKVAQTQSISQSAEQIFITQQTLSQEIGHLERELGMKLFIRKSSGVQLTAYGELFVAEAQAVLAEFAELTDFSQSLSLKDVTDQQLTIFSTPVVNKWLLPEPLAQLALRFPQCSVKLIEYDDSEVLLAQAVQQPCIAIVPVVEEYFTQVTQVQYEQRLNWQILLREPLQVCVSAHSFWAGKTAVTLEEFLALPLAASEVTDYVPLQKLAAAELKAPTFCTHNRSLLARAIKEGVAVSVYPSILNHIEKDKLNQQKDYTQLPFAEGLHEMLLFIWPKNAILPPAAQDLFARLQQILHKEAEKGDDKTAVLFNRGSQGEIL